MNSVSCLWLSLRRLVPSGHARLEKAIAQERNDMLCIVGWQTGYLDRRSWGMVSASLVKGRGQPRMTENAYISMIAAPQYIDGEAHI